MSLIFATNKPKNVTFAEAWDEEAGASESEVAGDRLWDAARDLGLYRDGSTAQSLATAEAYERRIKAIHEATGVQLVNPARQPGSTVGPGGVRTIRSAQEVDAEFRQQLFEVAEAHPDAAAVIGLDRPIREDALAVTKQAEEEFNAAMADAGRLSTVSRFGNVLGGSIAAMARDPLQVTTLFMGAGPSSARTVGGRLLQTILSEAAINAGVEGAVQASSQSWRKEAGVEHGLGPALQQVALAAAFGGGFGGIVAGGGEVFRALGKAPPPGALERIAAGEPLDGDFVAVADALGRPMNDAETRLADLVTEQATLDRDSFGPPPAGIAPEEAAPMAAEALRAIEEPVDELPVSRDPLGRDPEERLRQIERVLRAEQPLGQKPRQPQSLFDFLAEKGGIKDEGGALKAMGLSRKFVPGRGPLVRRNGMSLDYAREAAAEAGYLDQVAGNADEAVAISTPDQLLRLIEREAGGDRVFSRQMDGDLIDAAAEFEGRTAAREIYRRLLEQVDSAVEELALPKIDDRLLARAAQISAENGEDPALALERALDEDYRQFADALAEREEALPDDFDIPFFDDGPDAGAIARGSRQAADGGGAPAAGGRAAPAQPGGRLPDGGSPERASDLIELRPAGETPEPGTPQAAEAAAMALREAQPAAKAGDVETVGNFRSLRDDPEARGTTTDLSAVRINGQVFTAETHDEAIREAIARFDEATVERAIEADPEDVLGHVARPTRDTESVQTIDGPREQGLIEGVKPVSTREKLDVAAARPMRGGNAALPEGGLFDEGARQQIDLWDAMPAGRDAEGATIHATHADLVAEANRDAIFADIIQNCGI